MTLAGDLAPRQPRILTIDLERLPGEFTMDIWEPRDLKRVNYLHPDRWSALPTTLCLTAKWYDRARPRFIAAWDDPDDPFHCARELWPMMCEADIVLTYNGDRADLKWLASDWVMAGMPPPSPYRSVDLYKTARSAFSFESRSLRHLCDRLGVENKDGHYDAAEAKRAAAGHRPSQRNLRRYNIADVRVTEGVADRLGPWIRNWPNVGVYTGQERCCWRCGSEDLEQDGYTATALTQYALLRCRACGGWSRLNHRKHAVSTRAAR